MSYLCVDGGQTKTAVLLLDEAGERLHKWRTDPLTTPSKPGGRDHLRGVVRGVAEELRRRLEDSAGAAPEAACFSLSGYLEYDERVPEIVAWEVSRILPEVERVHTIPDYVGNWAAATRGEPGIVVVSGGGTVAYGRDDSGGSLRVGGWGHLLGDEGSGYWIGLEAIKAALRSTAGISAKTALEEKIMDIFDTDDDREVKEIVYSGSFDDTRFPGLVPLVASLSPTDEVADEILENAATHLAAMASAMLTRLGEELPVYLSGGVFRAPTMPERLGRALSATGHDAPVAVADSDPLEGVFLVAKKRLFREDSRNIGGSVS